MSQTTTTEADDSSIVIRDEDPRDRDAISAVTEAAFKDLLISPHTEQHVITALRQAGALTISLVASDISAATPYPVMRQPDETAEGGDPSGGKPGVRHKIRQVIAKAIPLTEDDPAPADASPEDDPVPDYIASLFLAENVRPDPPYKPTGRPFQPGIPRLSSPHDEVVGHIAFSPVSFSDGTPNWYNLGPVSVCPDHQGRGIGSALISEGLDQLRSIGGQGCVVIGDVAFYGRFGFEPASDLTYEGVPDQFVLALHFSGPLPHGLIHDHDAFRTTGEPAEVTTHADEPPTSKAKKGQPPTDPPAPPEPSSGGR